MEAAVRSRNISLITLLASLGANPNTTCTASDASGDTCVHVAAENGHVDVLHALTTVGANVNIPNSDGATAIFAAAELGDVVTIEALGKLGSDVCARKYDGHTPLHCAARNGHVETMVVLCRLGADVNAVSDKGGTALYEAAEMGRVEVIEALVRLGACVDLGSECDGVTPLCVAAQEGHVESVMALVRLGADINARDDVDGVTAVFAAVENGQLECMRVLAQLGADLNSCDADDVSLLHIAAASGSVEMVRVLGELGANANAEDRHGVTPVWKAAVRGYVSVLKALVEFRADVDAVKSDGSSAVCDAVSKGFNETAEFLVECGADVAQCCCGHNKDVSNIVDSMLDRFTSSLEVPRRGVVSDDSFFLYTNRHAQCTLFSLTKLLAFVHGVVPPTSGVAHPEVKESMETKIGICLRRRVPQSVIERLHTSPYALKRRLVRVASKVYHDSLLVDGDRLSPEVKTLRYVELACALLDLDMLNDLEALRMTCHSNCERRRFPVSSANTNDNYELEANLIEECVSYSSCRFLSTDVIMAVLAIHDSHSDQRRSLLLRNRML